MNKGLVLLALVGGVVGAQSVASAQIRLTEVMRTNVSAAAGEGNAWFIGRNLSAVAWDGRDLYVGGSSFNSAGSAIAKVTPQVGTTEGLYQLSGSFGFQATPATRGIFDLEVGGGTLGASADFGAGNVNGLRTFSTAGAAQGTASFTNRSNGLAYDPRDGRFYATSLSAGRALKINADGTTYNDGTRNWDTTTGPIFFSGSTENRDVAHDGNGTVFTRAANNIRKITEAGDGQLLTANNVAVVNATNNFIAGHNLDYINLAGGFLIYNDRPSVAAGQGILSVIKAVDTAGAAITLEFDFIDAFGDPLTGNGFYDFSYHAPSQTLAVSDFLNNTVHIFQVPTPGALGALAAVGVFAARRRR